MVYTKEIIITEMQYKYNVTKQFAEALYNEYKNNDDLNILINLLFK